MDDVLTKRERRRFVKQWHHVQRRWSPCYGLYGGWCRRCWWREVTGQNRRDKAEDLARMRRIVKEVIPLELHKNADGKWEPRGGWRN